VLRLNNNEIVFLRWLRTNGGQGIISTQSELHSAQQLIMAGYVKKAHPPDSIIYTLTDLGREALALEGD
jgi:hypothetical protein